MSAPDILPAPYNAAPAADGIAPRRETVSLVASQIDALLGQTPSFYALPQSERKQMRDQLTRIGAYAAELVRDDWSQSKRLGQTPLIKQEKTYRPANAPKAPAHQQALATTQAARADLRTSATSQVADITQSTLRAIAFPTFVADLINGTFDAIIGATIKQMQAFQELLANVSKTLDEFMRDNVSDNQARDYLVQAYPGLMQVDTSGDAPRMALTEGGEDPSTETLAGMQAQLGLPDPVSDLDEEMIEERLVPAARRKLAQSRLQMLSSMVMLGLQRIVIRHGRIRATMGFHIDASDRAHAEEASTFDFAHQNSVQGMFYVAFSARTSVAYVSSQQSDSDSAINVQADLTGEVDLTFESDYLPLNRLARAESIERIRQNTPNPEGNHPVNAAAGMTARQTGGPTAAQTVSDRARAHADAPAPSIADGLIDAASSAGSAATGAVTDVIGSAVGSAISGAGS
ncbi:hypothetical protein [Celeribacter arenosi]|uniref:Uncharacterized protein n=1 Tax=Celeribacter arenosi TaxID=792649 RepID=A0ABP7KHF3_9RHOB